MDRLKGPLPFLSYRLLSCMIEKEGGHKMPFNCLGDLYKLEIVSILKNKGFNVKDVHELNLILEKMGLLIKSGSHWMTTKAGVKYTIFNGPVLDAQAWHPSIVDLIVKFLKK